MGTAGDTEVEVSLGFEATNGEVSWVEVLLRALNTFCFFGLEIGEARIDGDSMVIPSNAATSLFGEMGENVGVDNLGSATILVGDVSWEARIGGDLRGENRL